MTAQEALQILDNVAAQTAMSRKDHMAVMEASRTLQELIISAAPKADVPQKEEPKK